MMQSGMSPSANDRMKNALGGGSGAGGLLEGLSGMLGGQQGGGLGDLLTGMLGGGGGADGILGNVLKEAGRAAGGNQNLALGGLGALAGAILGGGGKSMGGAMGGGVMALLAAMAFQALKGSGAQQPQVPLGLMEPQTKAARQELERHAEIIFKAMINAAKADGQIDQEEIRRIVGKLQEVGVDAESQQYVMAEMQKPMETRQLVAAAQGRPELAAELYGASLLAIEVDTPAEKHYLEQLAAGLGLGPEVTRRIQTMVGLQRV
jgi:uncharacterized membrane protein YebE (DUF533 family)